MAESEMYFSDTALDPDTTCSICYAEFLDAEDLSVHINQVHPGELTKFSVKCNFCSFFCRDLEDYAFHLRDNHISDLKCCKYCNRVFDDFVTFRRHEQKHNMGMKKNIYSCSNCESVFTTISELEEHELAYHRYSDQGTFLQHIFPLLSSILNIRVTKFLQCLGDCDITYICGVCDHTTPEVNDYIEHLKEKKCRSIVCDTCSSVYKTKKGLIRHLGSCPECYHSSSMLKQCLECFKEYEVKTLKEHVKICKPIKCKKCNIVFDNIFSLSKHQTEMHPAIVQLQSCKYCHKDFAGVVAMNKHIERAHQGQLHLYKYHCVHCDVVFKHPKFLFGHFFSTHKDLEPYTCKICDKKFRIRKKFTLHIKLDHKSIGYVEFDENYHVYFSETRSVQPSNKILTSEEGTLQETQGEKPNHAESESQKKDSPKNRVHFNIEDKQDNTNFDNTVNSDFFSATETEGNQTEADVEKTPRKRKIKNRINQKNKRPKTIEEVVISDSSDDDQPLVAIKQKVTKLRKSLAGAKRTKNSVISKIIKTRNNKNKFVCDICNKHCYTYQNYNNHKALHKKNVAMKCVKCSNVFRSKKALNEHYASEHSTSKLTETLRNLLNKRKSISKPMELTKNQKFKLTIKKVAIPRSEPAIITKAGEKPLSVQKFIENFTPEAEAPKKDNISIQTNITIKKIQGPPKKPLITMTKCNLEQPKTFNGQLAWPVPFKGTNEVHQVTIKPVMTSANKSLGDRVSLLDNQESYPDEDIGDIGDVEQDNNEMIPEVAQEVMLEGTEEPPPKIFIPHKVVIPKLPTECKKIHIAHLLPEAPFFKIVKVEDALNPKKKNVPAHKKDIKLPDGTTLVSVNPLAHLLGDTPVEKIMETSKNKHYQPKAKDFETAVAKAMLKLTNLDEPSPKKRKKLKGV
ncbi:unnamed protein product [Diatraea saccharalis]|uniref:C2H2-type domain-containing protein n=1 Tax=Diatraea saccharalis TaxID=40085 RepID=A0A9N9R6A5_9NEOP|nr:unnamed protein product [Diatraea saccharalis]